MIPKMPPDMIKATNNKKRQAASLIILFLFFLIGTIISGLIYPSYDVGKAVTLMTAFLTTIFIFFLPVLGWAAFTGKCKNYRKLASALKIKKPKMHLLLWSISLLLFSIPMYYFFVACNVVLVEQFTPIKELANTLQAQQNIYLAQILTYLDGLWGVLTVTIIIAILPAVGEEFFFRSAIQTQLQGIIPSRVTAIFLAAFIFSLLHIELYGFLVRLMLGILIGYILLKTENVVLCIVFHFLFNFTQIMVAFLWYDNPTDTLEYAEYTLLFNSWIWSGVGAILSFLACRYVIIHKLKPTKKL